MTYAQYAIAFIILSPIAGVVIGKLLKRNLDLNYPSADRELEALLADGLELALAKDAA